MHYLREERTELPEQLNVAGRKEDWAAVERELSQNGGEAELPLVVLLSRPGSYDEWLNVFHQTVMENIEADTGYRVKYFDASVVAWDYVGMLRLHGPQRFNKFVSDLFTQEELEKVEVILVKESDINTDHLENRGDNGSRSNWLDDETPEIVDRLIIGTLRRRVEEAGGIGDVLLLPV